MDGTIIRLVIDRGFGFIATSGETGKDIFFNVRDLDTELKWTDQLIERRVTFNPVGTDRGPRAANIRAALN